MIFQFKIFILLLFSISCIPDFVFGQRNKIKEKISRLKEINKEISIKKGEIYNNIFVEIQSGGTGEGKNEEYAPLIDEITPVLEESIDINLLDTVQYFIDSEHRIPKKFKTQLKNMATLANLGNERYEDKLLKLVENTFITLKEKYGLDNGNILRGILYNDLIPYTLSMLYSKKSTINSLYLLKDPFIGRGIPGEVPPTIYSQLYYKYFLLQRVHVSLLPKSLVEKYMENKIVEDVKEWEEALSTDEVWRSIVDY